MFDRDNHLVVGLSLDRGSTQFTAGSELGTIDGGLFVTGTGVFIDQPLAGLTPVSLLAKNTYTGIYATDTIDVTSALSVTAGARFNRAQINLLDETGTNPLLTSTNNFHRINPVIGATYKVIPNMTAYAGYSEANRAPTPLELGCSDPAHPCMIDNFLISDPPLKQVVSRTYEAGVRGTLGEDAKSGRLCMGAGGVPGRDPRRHHQRRERRGANVRLLPERGQDSPPRHRGKGRLRLGPLAHVCQLHVH